jgi:hypothetical protein
MSIATSSGNWPYIAAVPGPAYTALIPVYFNEIATGGGASNQYIFHRGDSSWTLYEGARADGSATSSTLHRTGGFNGNSIITLTAATWYHYMFTYAPESNPGVSADGVLTARASSNGTSWGTAISITGCTDMAATHFLFGVSRIAGSDILTGRFGPTKIWSRVLTPTEALAEVPYRLPVDASGIWAVYPFRTGALTTDEGGSTRTLSLTGAPTFTADEPTWVVGDSNTPTPQPPATPSITNSYIHEFTGDLVIVASGFSDPDGDNHAATQWQVRNTLDPDWTTPIYNVTVDSGPLTSIDIPEATHTAWPAGTYEARVRYQDDSTGA